MKDLAWQLEHIEELIHEDEAIIIDFDVKFTVCNSCEQYKSCIRTSHEQGWICEACRYKQEKENI